MTEKLREKEALLLKGWNVCPEGGKSSYAFSQKASFSWKAPHIFNKLST